MTSVITVITTFEPSPDVAETVARALAQTDAVIVVDDGSPSLSDPASPVHGILAGCVGQGAEVIRSDENRGIAHALNVGVAQARSRGADAVLTLDQDTLIADDYVARAVDHLALAASLGLTDVMVSPALINGEVAPFWFAEQGLTLAFEPIQSGLIITESLFAAIGVFTEELFIDCVETEFYLRMREHGGHALVVPGGRIEHRLGNLTQWRPPRLLRPVFGGRESIEFGEDAPFRHYYIARNRVALYRRYGRREPLWTAVSIVKDTIARGRAIAIGTQRRSRIYLSAAGTRAALRGQTGPIPTRTLVRSRPAHERAHLIGDPPEEPDRGLPDLVSVVIPVRDAVDVIDTQLDALAAQDYAGAFEVVVADNGSTDGLAAHLAAHRHADRLRLRRVDASDGVGAGHARNVGAAAADGDFLAFCDADDRAYPQWLSALVARARTLSAVGGPVETHSLNSAQAQSWRHMLPRGEDYALHGFLRVWPTCNLGVWTDVFTRVGGFDTDYIRGGEDSDLTLRIQLAGGVLGQAPDALMAYRLRDTLAGIWGQSVMCGEGDVRLYADYRSYGMPRRPWWQALDVVAFGLLRNPLLPERATRVPTGRWLFEIGNLVGRVKGSLRHRVWYV